MFLVIFDPPPWYFRYLLGFLEGLGHGGKVPEELTGALLAAANLEWNADEKLMVVTGYTLVLYT